MAQYTPYYVFAFNYTNGRRALSGNYSIDFAHACEIASDLSRKKKRVIVVNGVSYKYGRNNNLNMATGQTLIPLAKFKDGRRI